MTLRVHPDRIVQTSPSPLLRIHGSWGRVPLGDIAHVLNGFAFKSSEFNATEGMPLIRIRDVGASTTAVRYSGDYDARYIVDPGTIVVGMDGDFRAARWAGPAALLNQRVCTITVRDRRLYDEGFLLYVLPGYLDAINAETSSITVKHLSSETLKEVPLPLPPLAEQRRIVAAIEEQLSRLDVAIDTLHSVGSRAVAARSSILKAVFSQFPRSVSLATATDPKRPICYGILKPKTAGELVVPYVEVRSIRDGPIDLDSLHRTTLALHEEFARSTLRSGDVVMAIRGSWERAAVVPPELDGANVSRDVARIAPLPQLNPQFLSYFLASPLAGRDFARVARGVGVRGVNISDLRQLRVPCPRRPVQDAAVEQLDEALAAVAAVSVASNTAIRRAESLRRSILATAFRGELVPQDPDDEPASVLLERIAAERAAAPPAPRRRRARAAS